MTGMLHETIRRMPPPPDGGTTVAVDGTGLAPGAISTCVVNRGRDRGAGVTWRHWLKGVVVVDLPRRLILAQAAKRGPTHDGPPLRPLLDGARHVAPIRCVLADGEFDSQRQPSGHPARRRRGQQASPPRAASGPGTCMACGRSCAPTAPVCPTASAP